MGASRVQQQQVRMRSLCLHLTSQRTADTRMNTLFIVQNVTVTYGAGKIHCMAKKWFGTETELCLLWNTVSLAQFDRVWIGTSPARSTHLWRVTPHGAKGRSRQTERWRGKGCCHRRLLTRCSFCLQVNSYLVIFTSLYQDLLVSYVRFECMLVLFWRNVGKWRTLRWCGFLYSATSSTPTDRSDIWSEEFKTVATWSATWISSRWKQHHQHASVWCGFSNQCTCTVDRSRQYERRRWWNIRRENTAETTGTIGCRNAVAKSRTPSSLGIWSCRCKYAVLTFTIWPQPQMGKPKIYWI